jgi:Flp pilus assembly protein TadG
MKRCLRAGDRGALTLSYVIVFPVFMLALMVIVQASVWFLGRQAALAAARQGVTAATARNAPLSAGPAAAITFARASAGGLLRAPAADDQGSTPRTVVITVRARVPSLIPGLPITVSETVQEPRERFYAGTPGP